MPCVQAPVRIGVIFKHLRKLMDSLLEKKLANPKMNLEGKPSPVPYISQVPLHVPHVLHVSLSLSYM